MANSKQAALLIKKRKDVVALRLHQVIGRRTQSDAIWSHNPSPPALLCCLRPHHYPEPTFPLVLQSRCSSWAAPGRSGVPVSGAARELLEPAAGRALQVGKAHEHAGCARVRGG